MSLYKINYSQRRGRLAYWLIEIDSEVIGQEFIFEKPKRQNKVMHPPCVTRWTTSWRLAFWLFNKTMEKLTKE